MRRTQTNEMKMPANTMLSALMAITTSACALSSEHAPEDTVAPAGSVVFNGLNLNGLNLNGLNLNGLNLNGLEDNGLNLNGLNLNGLNLNGLNLNGLNLNGLNLNGLNLNGLSTEGLALTGIHISSATTSIGTSNTSQHGRNLDHVGLNGFYLGGDGYNGITVGGVAITHTALTGVNGRSLVVNGKGNNGILINRLPAKGTAASFLVLQETALRYIGTDSSSVINRSVDQVRLNGLYLAGTQAGTLVVNNQGLVEAALDNLVVNGTGMSGLRVLDQSGQLAPLTAAQQQSLDYALFHLVGCALDKGSSVTITAADGSAKRYSGLRGVAPEWQRGPLSAAGSQKVLSCLLSSDSVYESAALTTSEEAAFHHVLNHVVGCALPAGSSVSVIASDSTTKTFAGVRGFAPEWATGPLSAAGSIAVRACLESTVSGDAIGLNPEQERDFIHLFGYLATCALTSEQTVSLYTTDGTAQQFTGALGLAPEWATGPLSQRGQQRVSACLAARSNANGQAVLVSLRGADIATTAVERAIYRQHEGAFWGDFFGSKAQVYSCSVDGAGISGRVCTEGECGFVDMGSCESVCATKDPIDGHYTDCNGSSEVINIFLSITDRVAFGKNHSCFRKDDGSLWCWGENTAGKLGDGTEVSRLAPAPVSALGNDVDEVAAGANHTCARKNDGSVWCWGDNSENQIGSGSNAIEVAAPQQVAVIGNDVASLAVGNQHACGLKTDGSLWCWGDNLFGQLGAGDTAAHSAPVKVDALGHDVATVSLGDCAQHTCAVTNDGSAFCWGWNDAGQLGNGTLATSAQPVEVTTDAKGNEFGNVTDLCTGWMHTCARKDDGSVWCWGSNDKGRLGNPALAAPAETRPVRVALATPVIQGGLTCAMDHTCAITTDGKVSCWGGNEHGQLGNGTMNAAGSAAPQQVVGLSGAAVRLSADSTHTCATLADSSLWCWGKNNGNLIFDGATSSTPVNVAIPELATYAPAGFAVSIGSNSATLTWVEHTAPSLDHYEVYRNGSLVHIAGPQSVRWTNSPLAAGTYCYKLRAVLTDGTTSAFSQEVCKTIP